MGITLRPWLTCFAHAGGAGGASFAFNASLLGGFGRPQGADSTARAASATVIRLDLLLKAPLLALTVRHTRHGEHAIWPLSVQRPSNAAPVVDVGWHSWTAGKRVCERETNLTGCLFQSDSCATSVNGSLQCCRQRGHGCMVSIAPSHCRFVEGEGFIQVGQTRRPTHHCC